MGILDRQVTNPSFPIISQINKQYIKDAKLQTLSDSQRSSIRDLILKSMGFTARPSQRAHISESPLAAHHRNMQDDLSYMSRESRLGLISPLLDYLLEDASRFTPKTLETLKVMREFLLAKDFFITREYLLQNIWKYSSNSETTTIEACMNKLRNKLPNATIEYSKDGYQLYAEGFI